MQYLSVCLLSSGQTDVIPSDPSFFFLFTSVLVKTDIMSGVAVAVTCKLNWHILKCINATSHRLNITSTLDFVNSCQVQLVLHLCHNFLCPQQCFHDVEILLTLVFYHSYVPSPLFHGSAPSLSTDCYICSCCQFPQPDSYSSISLQSSRDKLYPKIYHSRVPSKNDFQIHACLFVFLIKQLKLDVWQYLISLFTFLALDVNYSL